jgi:pimeloyl-ACP methyl ester carboxylesterase
MKDRIERGFHRLFVVLSTVFLASVFLHGGPEGALWWEVVLSALISAALLYLALAGVFLAVRWVVRGFRADG